MNGGMMKFSSGKRRFVYNSFSSVPDTCDLVTQLIKLFKRESMRPATTQDCVSETKAQFTLKGASCSKAR